MVEQWSSKPYAWVRFLLSLIIKLRIKNLNAKPKPKTFLKQKNNIFYKISHIRTKLTRNLSLKLVKLLNTKPISTVTKTYFRGKISNNIPLLTTLKYKHPKNKNFNKKK